MRFSSRHAALIGALLFTTACGPVRSTLGLIQADKALQEAREMKVAEYAPYPMTLAESLRQKAFEEQGYGAYDTAMNMAREAETLAREAIDLTRAATAPEPSVSPEVGEPKGEDDDDDDQPEAPAEDVPWWFKGKGAAPDKEVEAEEDDEEEGASGEEEESEPVGGDEEADGPTGSEEEQP